jgi:serine/threonine protein kinase
MAVAAGAKLGPYEILAPIGAGGMGEVYRARDTKLKRDVALKVLPETFASDPERMARFQREAEVLASLNHPNIAHIYGVEERALVMELSKANRPKGQCSSTRLGTSHRKLALRWNTRTTKASCIAI